MEVLRLLPASALRGIASLGRSPVTVDEMREAADAGAANIAPRRRQR
jgi:hypothetical protein